MLTSKKVYTVCGIGLAGSGLILLLLYITNPSRRRKALDVLERIAELPAVL